MAEVNDRKMTAQECSLCSPVSRRDFVKAVGFGALAGTVPIIGRSAAAAGPTQVGPTAKDAAETAVARFYKTLTPEQRKIHLLRIRPSAPEASRQQLGYRQAGD